MESIIIGGGKIGYYLFKTLRSRHYQVMMVERDKNLSLKIANELNSEVICGDGTDLDVLRDAGIEEAQVVAAVTGTDEENLVICQIAKVRFQIEKTIARINNPKNIAMFRALGIDRIVCSTQVIADMIEYDLDRGNCRVVQTLEHGTMLLAEMSITSQNSWKNCLIRNLKLPKECVIVSIIHEETIIYPRGDTLIAENDKVLFITNRETFNQITKSM